MLKVFALPVLLKLHNFSFSYLYLVLSGMLLKFAVDWNTNSRHSRVAQTLLTLVLRNYLPSDLASLPDIQNTVEALTVYTGIFINKSWL